MSVSVSFSSRSPAPSRVVLVSMEWTPEVSGGVGTYVYELGHGLAAHGHAVLVLCYTAGAPRVVSEGNLTVHFVPPSATNLAQSSQRSLVEGILSINEDLLEYGRSVVEAFGPTVVHFHQWHTRRAALGLAHAARVPVLGTAHHISEPAERWWGQDPDPEIVKQERDLFCGDHPVVVVSHSMKDILCRTHAIAPDLIHVIHCALDPKPFRQWEHRDAEVARLRATIAAPDECVVLYTGRIHPQKGLPAIYAAARMVMGEARRPVRYLLAGGTDSRASTQMIGALERGHEDVADRIVLLGKLPRNQLPLLHRVADFAVVPSVYEPFGFTALESMASGLPVVVSDDGGLAEIVEHERSGLKVAVRDVPHGMRSIDIEAFAAAQLRMIEEPERRHAWGRGAIERVTSAFSIQAMVEANVALYAKLEHDPQTIADPRVRAVPSRRTSPWLSQRREPRATHRVILFPHAGGGSTMFRDWRGHFTAGIEPVLVQLPGRERRMAEPLCRRLAEAAEALAEAVSQGEGDYSFFGHSMGALLAFEVARRLEAAGHPGPAHLFVASYCAPQSQNGTEIRRNESEAEIVERIAGNSQLDRDAAAELFATLRPIFLADIEMCETYRYVPGTPLGCPIHTHRGVRDYVSDRDMAGWAAQTRAGFSQRNWSGDHFFVAHHGRALVNDIITVIQEESEPALEATLQGVAG